MVRRDPEEASPAETGEPYMLAPPAADGDPFMLAFGDIRSARGRDIGFVPRSAPSTFDFKRELKSSSELSDELGSECPCVHNPLLLVIGGVLIRDIGKQVVCGGE